MINGRMVLTDNLFLQQDTRASTTSTQPTRYSARMRKIELIVESNSIDSVTFVSSDSVPSGNSSTPATPDR